MDRWKGIGEVKSSGESGRLSRAAVGDHCAVSLLADQPFAVVVAQCTVEPSKSVSSSPAADVAGRRGTVRSHRITKNCDHTHPRLRFFSV